MYKVFRYNYDVNNIEKLGDQVCREWGLKPGSIKLRYFNGPHTQVLVYVQDTYMSSIDKIIGALKDLKEILGY